MMDDVCHTAIPEPINRHLSDILLLIATRLFGNKQTGFFSLISILVESLAFVTVPNVAAVPIFNLRDSLIRMGSTFTSS
jgi:hypothetical protein